MNACFRLPYKPLLVFTTAILLVLAVPAGASARTIFVNAARGDDTAGTGSKALPYKSISRGVSATIPGSGDIVSVAAGTYTTTIGETFPIYVKSGTQLIGENRETTIVDGLNYSSVLLYLNTSSATTRVSGLTIKRGSEGIEMMNGAAVVTDNVLTDNRCPSSGGGIYVSNNTSSGTPVIAGNTITGNHADYLGGGIYVYASTAWIYGNVISYNNANNEAGGVDLSNANATICNNLIIHNSTGGSGSGGGLTTGNDSVPLIEGNTIVSNTSALFGGGININGSVSDNPTMRGNIVRNNSPSDVIGNFGTQTYSAIGTGRTTGTGVITTDPLFIDAASDNYRLITGSPALNISGLVADSYDLLGVPRPQGANSDMGVYEKTTGGVDVGIYRSGAGYPNWYVKLSPGLDPTGGATWPVNFGNPTGDTPFSGDFNGDGKSDLAIYRYGSYPNWIIYLAKGDATGFAAPVEGNNLWSISYGNPGGDTPLIGDFNNDGKSDLAIYRYGSSPNWIIYLAKGDGTGFAAPVEGNNQWSIAWGNPGGDTPLAGDFNGDGKSDIGIYRTGSYPNWFVKTSAGGDVRTGSTLDLSWGNPGGDTPLVGDFNGDGKKDIGVYRTGSYPNWFFLPSLVDGTGFVDPVSAWALSWGNAGGDRPIVGNFDGDRKLFNRGTWYPIDDIGVYRTGSLPNWFFKTSAGRDVRGGPTVSLSWGNPGGDTPFIGDFNGDSPRQ